MKTNKHIGKSCDFIYLRDEADLSQYENEDIKKLWQMIEPKTDKQYKGIVTITGISDKEFPS